MYGIHEEVPYLKSLKHDLQLVRSIGKTFPCTFSMCMFDFNIKLIQYRRGWLASLKLLGLDSHTLRSIACLGHRVSHGDGCEKEAHAVLWPV